MPRPSTHILVPLARPRDRVIMASGMKPRWKSSEFLLIQARNPKSPHAGVPRPGERGTAARQSCDRVAISVTTPADCLKRARDPACAKDVLEAARTRPRT